VWTARSCSVLLRPGILILDMEASPRVNDAVPELYRAILLLVEELERSDGRVEAARIRREAINAYSRSWDPSQQRRLERLQARLRRALATRRQPQRGIFRLP
jgi:hypothetical protein